MKKMLLLFVVIILFPINAESASISNVDVFSTGKHLVFDISLKNRFSENVVEAINSGVQVGITYTVVLKRKIPFFIDKNITTRTIKKYVKYDTLKEEYNLIEVNGKKVNVSNTESFEEVVKEMTTLESIHVIPDHKLSRGKKYYISVKAELNSKRSWFPFNYIFLFVPFLNFDTSWENSSPFTVK